MGEGGEYVGYKVGGGVGAGVGGVKHSHSVHVERKYLLLVPPAAGHSNVAPPSVEQRLPPMHKQSPPESGPDPNSGQGGTSTCLEFLTP